MSANDLPGGIVSVSTMASTLRLSRDRFYELIRSGVFPPPVYDLVSRRPHYPTDLQEVCRQVVRSGIGFDGRPVLFYRKRRDRAKSGRVDAADHRNPYAEKVRRLGFTVSRAEVGEALHACFPGGHSGVSEDDVLRALCRHLRQASALRLKAHDQAHES